MRTELEKRLWGNKIYYLEIKMKQSKLDTSITFMDLLSNFLNKQTATYNKTVKIYKVNKKDTTLCNR